MKKGTLIEIILANVGGLFLAMGLFMIFMNDWNMLGAGITATVLGAINLVALIVVRRIYHDDKVNRWKSTLARLIIILAAIAMGSGASQMIANKHVRFGLVIWILGIIFSTLSYPILEYIKKDKEKVIKTILATVGSVLLFVGMSMTFIRTWDSMFSGTIIGLAGIICEIVYVLLSKKENEEYYYINIRFIFFFIIEIIGAFFTVFGVVKVSSMNASMPEYHHALIIGLIACATGFVISALSIPIYIFNRSNHPERKGIQISLKSKEYSYSIRNLIIMFFIYAVFGWIIEVSFYGVTNSIFVNRGFLHLPLLPIYGFGAVAVTIIFRKNQDNVFIKSAILASVLEYITSAILENIYGFRWWNYSSNPLNINGRVCLLNSLMFGLGGYIIAKFISPYIDLKLNKMNRKFLFVVASIIVISVSADFMYTLDHPNTGDGVTTKLTETQKANTIVEENNK